jgi:hypothetical protein
MLGQLRGSGRTLKVNTTPQPWTLSVSTSTRVLGVGLLLAALFGWALAEEAWIGLAFLIVVGLVPIFVRWPVVSTFGVYALLVPFESAVFPELGGSTVLKPIGALAGAVLLAIGLIERRLGRPPRSALWWGLFVVWAALSAAWALDPQMVF